MIRGTIYVNPSEPSAASLAAYKSECAELVHFVVDWLDVINELSTRFHSISNRPPLLMLALLPAAWIFFVPMLSSCQCMSVIGISLQWFIVVMALYARAICLRNGTHSLLATFARYMVFSQLAVLFYWAILLSLHGDIMTFADACDMVPMITLRVTVLVVKVVTFVSCVFCVHLAAGLLLRASRVVPRALMSSAYQGMLMEVLSETMSVDSDDGDKFGYEQA